MNLEELWRKIELFPDKEIGSPASVDDISYIENSLDLKIRGGYREFLRRYGWARFAHEEIFGFGKGVPDRSNVLVVATRERLESEPPMSVALLPVMADGAGNYYCLELSKGEGSEPAIVFSDHETGKIENVDTKIFSVWLTELLERLTDRKSFKIDITQ